MPRPPETQGQHGKVTSLLVFVCMVALILFGVFLALYLTQLKGASVTAQESAQLEGEVTRCEAALTTAENALHACEASRPDNIDPPACTPARCHELYTTRTLCAPVTSVGLPDTFAVALLNRYAGEGHRSLFLAETATGRAGAVPGQTQVFLTPLVEPNAFYISFAFATHYLVVIDGELAVRDQMLGNEGVWTIMLGPTTTRVQATAAVLEGTPLFLAIDAPPAAAAALLIADGTDPRADWLIVTSTLGVVEFSEEAAPPPP